MTSLPAVAPPEGPSPVAERIGLLDVLRGFALYGVLLANTAVFYSGRAFLPRAEAAARSDSLDEVASWLLSVFVDGKALTLLTFLFGLGFAVQLERAETQGRSVVPIFLRRLLILLAIGICHMLLLWWGDILQSYAVAGLALLLFRRRSGRGLLLWAAGLIFVPQLVSAVPAASAAIARVLGGPADRAAFNAELLAALSGDDHGRLLKMQVLQAFHHVTTIAVWFFPWTLGRFLVGYFAGRRRWLHDVPEHLPFFRKLLGWGLGLGIAGSIVTAVRRALGRRDVVLPDLVKLALKLPEEAGLLAMTAAYVAAVVLLMQRPAWRRRLMLVAPVGQMPLTSYLSQSLVCTFVFYGWGLGLIGRVGPARCIPLTLAIFAAQIAFSRAWLARYRFGPMEWLWRSLTYGRAQPMRRLGP